MESSTTFKDIAVLSASHNRRVTTLTGLDRLFKLNVPAGYRLRVYLVDDGSTDGTGDAVRQQFPQVTVLSENGSNFFFHSIYLAWNAARPADFFLWLNDDVNLNPEALRTLIDVYDASGDPTTIVIGGTCDPITGKTCTGGIRRPSWHTSEVMIPTDTVQMCDSMNGNIVLVPRQADEKIGMMDEVYTHMFGDADYGIRARKAGVPVLLAPGHLGTTELNRLKGTVHDLEMTFRDRWNLLFGPKGHRPPDQWWRFVRAHAPHPKTLYFFVPYVACIAEGLLGSRFNIRRDMRRPVERIYE
jgi:glycosyltransferase involved in cell wall biosynthesis